MLSWRLIAIWLVGVVAVPALAQMVEVKDQSSPAVGKDRAREYFQSRPKASGSRREPASGGAPRYLAIHLGTFFTDQAYKWGKGDMSDIGKLNAGVTYRVGEWVNSMDMNMRVEYTSYDLGVGSARKLSFSGLITFPDANSRFPLYFGAGAGAGFFIKQVNKESALAFDYQLVAGARFMNVIENVGFSFETGLKNHIHMLSDGQFNGVFVNLGTVFAF